MTYDDLEKLEVGKILKVVLEQINAEPEIYTELAKALKYMYDAFVEQGFTEEQALTLISQQSGNLLGK